MLQHHDQVPEVVKEDLLERVTPSDGAHVLEDTDQNPGVAQLQRRYPDAELQHAR